MLQVQHVFSDKTGTLTCNQMKFRRLSVVAPGAQGAYSSYVYGAADDDAEEGGASERSVEAGGGERRDVQGGLDKKLDQKREAVFAAVTGGRMVRVCARVCVFSVL